MARKPFKIVNNLDLSGNKLIDVSEIYRGNYDLAGVNNHLTIKAGSDPAGLPDTVGGTLYLYSGKGASANGAIELRTADSGYGITLASNTKASITTNNTDIELAIANATTAAVKVTAATEVTGATTGALQVAGGVYIAKDLLVNGGDIFTKQTTANLYNTADTATRVNIAGYSAEVNIANTRTAARSINIATGGSAANTINVGNDIAASTTTIHSPVIQLGTATARSTTVTVGGQAASNTVKVRSTEAGTVNFTGDVTTGIVNFMTGLTGTANIVDSALAINLGKSAITTVQIGSGASTVRVGGVNAKLHVGTTSGTIDTGTASSTANVFNDNATTVNAFGAATALALGNAASTITLKGTTVTAPQLHTFSLNGASASTLTLQGSTATKLKLFNTTQTTVDAFGAATAITMGASTGSTFTVNSVTTTLANATTVSAAKAKTINIGTATNGAVTATIGTLAHATTIDFPGSSVTLSTASTGTLNLFDSGITTVKAFAAATAIDIGSAASTAIINLNTTKDATDSTVGGVVVDGGVAIAKKLFVGSDTTLGTAVGNTATVRGKLQLLDSQSAYRLILGGSTDPVELYRSGSNELTIADNIVIAGVLGVTAIKAAATVNAFADSTTINIGQASSTTTNKGNFVVEGTTDLRGELDHILFKAHAALRPRVAGELYYSTIDDTLMFTPSIAGVYLSVGQEMYARVKNDTASTIANGTVVYRVNGTEDYISVAPARADSVATSAVIGIVTHDIAAGATGFATVRGIVRGLNTAGTAAGKAYLSATEAGKITSTAPLGTNYVVELGDIQIVDSVNGSIYVAVQQSWTDVATFNGFRAVNAKIHDRFELPKQITTTDLVAGLLRYSTATDDKFLKAYDGTVWKTIVDTDSAQDLTGKTYNGLTLTKRSTGFNITGGTAEKTLLLGMDLTVQIGKVVLEGAAGGASVLKLPNTTFTLNTATAGYAAYYSAAGTLSGEQYLSVSRGGTGRGTLTANAILTGNAAAGIQTPGPTLTSTELAAANLTVVNIATSTTAPAINIATGAVATGTKVVNIGTGSVVGSTTNVTIGSPLGTTNTYLNGNVTIGDAVEKTITLTGTISAAGIKIFDANSTTYSYTLTPGNIAANTAITLPTTTGRYFTVGLRADGLIDLKSVMAGTGSTALAPSAGGIVWTDANGFQILSGTSTAGKALISGNLATPTWSTGTLSLATNLATKTGAVTIVGNVADTSQLTLPAGNLTLPSSVVAGDIIYGSGTGTLTRLAKVAAGSVLVSGNSPTWSATPTVTSMTLSAATAGLTFSGATSADIVASTATTANIFATTASIINVGGAVASTTLNLLGDTATGVVNINSTKASSSYATGALVVDGGVGIAGALHANSSATFAGDVAVNGNNLTSTQSTFNFLNTNVTTLNMLNTAGAKLYVGSDNASVRSVHMRADMEIGTVANSRTVNHYGHYNFGGPTGFAAYYNSTDNSFDIVKL